jgi:hypothetical protein
MLKAFENNNTATTIRRSKRTYVTRKFRKDEVSLQLT